MLSFLAVFCSNGTISSLLFKSLFSTEVQFDEILKLFLKLLQEATLFYKISQYLLVCSLNPAGNPDTERWLEN